MKVVRTETLISKGLFASSDQWREIRESALEAVQAGEWPLGSGSFTIHPQSGKKRGEGNGVKPIKLGIIEKLCKGLPTYGQMVKTGRLINGNAWVAEHPWPVGERVRPGKMDAAYLCDAGITCFEWETGNISSSHRSINKICLGLLLGVIKAGILVVPSRSLYIYLTDRIGNISELEPYFPLWRSIPCEEGVFEIFVVEHDAVSFEVPRIPKGTDGRAAS